MARGPKQKQMGVSLPDDLRKMLEDACAGTDRSIAEEIRRRLLRTFQDDVISMALRIFMAKVGLLGVLVRTQTGQDWRTHPAANAIMRHAFNALLARTKEAGPEIFAPGELPIPSRRIVAAGSDDPQTMGVALEARLQALIEPHEGNAYYVLLHTMWGDAGFTWPRWRERDGKP
jgi:hypothetical protein